MLNSVGLIRGVLLVHIDRGLLDRTTVVGCPVSNRLIAVARGTTLENIPVLCICCVTSRVHRVLKLMMRMGVRVVLILEATVSSANGVFVGYC